MSEGDPEPRLLPFEDPAYSWLDGFGQTIRLLIVRPREAFSRMRVEGGLGRPIQFAALLMILGLLLSAMIGVVVSKVLPSAPPESALAYLLTADVHVLSIQIKIALIGFLVVMALFHFSLIMIAGVQRGIGTTFRVACYSTVASLGAAIPYGLSSIWFFALLVIGARVAHETSYRQAVFALLAPLLLVFGCLYALVFVAMAIMSQFS